MPKLRAKERKTKAERKKGDGGSKMSGKTARKLSQGTGQAPSSCGTSWDSCFRLVWLELPLLAGLKSKKFLDGKI